jgi:hypothetical protein
MSSAASNFNCSNKIEEYMQLSLTQKRGNLLGKPKLGDWLPPTYKEEEVRSGADVDYVFNACPADNPVNAGRVSKDFRRPEQIDISHISRSTHEYGPGSYVATSKTSPLDKARLELPFVPTRLHLFEIHNNFSLPSSPTDFFHGSEKFTINDGKFNSIGRDMHTSTVNHNDNSITTITINNCVFSWNNFDPKENHNPPSEPPSDYSVFTHSSLSEPPTDCSPLPSSSPKCHRCWSTSIFIPVVYYPYIPPGIMYPVSSICPISFQH